MNSLFRKNNKITTIVGKAVFLTTASSDFILRNKRGESHGNKNEYKGLSCGSHI
jgi:hypothetical protein